MNKAFVDTNILIYAYSATEPEKKRVSLELLSQEEVLISTQVVNEFIWVMFRKFSIQFKQINEIVKNFFKNFQIGAVDKEVIFKAIKFAEKYKYSYWDASILSYALLHNCKLVYTEDMQHNQIIDGTLKIVNPFTL